MPKAEEGLLLSSLSRLLATAAPINAWQGRSCCCDTAEVLAPWKLLWVSQRRTGIKHCPFNGPSVSAGSPFQIHRYQISQIITSGGPPNRCHRHEPKATSCIRDSESLLIGSKMSSEDLLQQQAWKTQTLESMGAKPTDKEDPLSTFAPAQLCCI